MSTNFSNEKVIVFFIGGAGDKNRFWDLVQPVLWKAFNLYLNQR